MFDEILEKYGLKYEDLNAVERETYNSWSAAFQQGALSIEKIRQYISTMRDSVEQQLEDEPEFLYVFIFRVFNRKQLLLKARLKNYRLFEALLSTPERAKQQVERMIASMVPVKK